MGPRNCRLLLALACMVLPLALDGCKGRGRPGEGISSPGGPALEEKVERRAAFDFGSGTMKLRMFDMRLQGQRPVGATAVSGGDYTVRVDYQADLNDSPTGTFSKAIRLRGSKAAKRLKAHAVAMGASRFAGVCTGAFRQARDGGDFVAQLSRETGIRLLLPSAQDEARLGFLAARGKTRIPGDRLVVWDIGAATQSLTVLGEDGRFVTHVSSLASVTLRDQVIRRIKGQSASVKTPNPMTPSDVALAVRLAEGATREPMDAAVTLRLNRAPTRVIGIGPVHYFSVREQIPPNYRYDQNGVNRALKDQTGKTDAEIGGSFPDTQVINLALVLGSMRGLKIREVRPVDVNIAHGLLFDPSLWQ